VSEGYAGIRYESRLGPWECWAVFDDVRVEQVEQRPIELDDPAMLSVANDFGLRIFRPRAVLDTCAEWRLHRALLTGQLNVMVMCDLTNPRRH